MENTKQLPLLGEHWLIIDELTELLLRLRYLRRWQRLPAATLVIGPEAAGKSSLIKASGLDFDPVLHSNEQHFTAWISKAHLFIEIHHSLLERFNAQGWEQMGKLCRKFRRTFPITRVLITLEIAWIIEQPAQQCQDTFSDISRCLSHFSRGNKPSLNTDIIFTQCDRIVGFSAYFSCLTGEQRQHKWGIKSETEFARLLDRLQDKTLTRLQQTQSIHKRRLIKEFPLQIESLRHHCLVAVRTLTRSRQTNDAYLVKGAYFTSSQQHGKRIDLLANTIPSDYACALLPTPPNPHLTEIAFFIRDLFGDQHATPPRKVQFPIHYLKYVAGIAASAVLVSSLFLMKDRFNLTVQTLQSVQNHLQMEITPKLFEANREVELDEILLQIEQLASLQQEQLDNLAWYSLGEESTLSSLGESVDDIIKQTLQQRLLPLAAQNLAAQITALHAANPEMTYYLLKAYLMLGEPERMDSDYFSGLLAALWQAEVGGDTEKLALRLKWLQYTLDLHQQALPLDSRVIRQARASLREIPAGELVAIWLKEANITAAPITIVIGPGIQWEIPFEYSKHGAIRILQQDLPRFTKQLSRGDWVVGILPHAKELKQAQLRELADQSTAYYLNNYRTWWQQVMTHGIGNHHQGFGEYIDWLGLLSNDPDYLLKFIAPMQEHTAALKTEGNISDAFNQQVAQHFQGFEAIHPQGITQLAPFFSNLHDFLSTLNHLPDRQTAALRIAQQRFNHNLENDPLAALFVAAELEPEPLRQWLTAIAQEGWQNVLILAEAEIQQQWRSSVYPFYRDNIAQRFPTHFDAEEEISLTDFQKFFSKRGTLNQFYRHYLAPFIDTDHASWQSKTLDGLSINITTEHLPMLQLMSIIQSMFFNPISDQFDVAFALQPAEFNPYLQQITLTLDGTQITDYKGSNTISEIHWQGNSSGAQLIIQDTNGDQFKQNIEGDWAWLRLLDQDKQPTDDPRIFTLTFSQDDLPMIRYHLSSADAINPFIPDVIDYFELSEHMIS